MSEMDKAVITPSSSRKRRTIREIVDKDEGRFMCRESYCGLNLKDGESLDKHYKVHLDHEMEKLSRLRVKKEKIPDPGVDHRNTRNIAFERLKERRNSRISNEALTENSTVTEEHQSCPLCHVRIEGSLDDLKEHFSTCLTEEHEENVEEVLVDIEEDDYEEYEWAGQRRIRSTSLFRGGLKAAGFLTIRQTREDEVLDVIGDEEEMGSTQYEDSDLLDASKQPEVDDTTEDNIDSKCKICMSVYQTPLVSTACWHVHCEKCWLLSLGTKKLCPQCKAIVTPGDLRKIFL